MILRPFLPHEQKYTLFFFNHRIELKIGTVVQTPRPITVSQFKFCSRNLSYGFEVQKQKCNCERRLYTPVGQ